MAWNTPDLSFNSPDFAGAANRALEGPAGGASLLAYLLDTAIIHPENWAALPLEFQDRLLALTKRELLLKQLTDLKLINEYQAARIQAGTFRGLVLGNYRVLNGIGSGGIGIIFEAEHILMRRSVAIKVVPVDARAEPDIITRFFREIRFVAHLNHPNIVAAFDAGVAPSDDPFEPDLYYFVMERLIGSDLSQVAAGRPVEIARACAWICQIASALDEAHRHQLVHRDIKPSNVFVTQDGQAKLLDFGLVRHLPGNAITQPDLVIGTLDYMAPEQAIDPTDVDIRTDVYGLGATLYFALTGASPFPMRGPLLQMIAQRQTQTAPSPRQARAEIPYALDELVQRMMALHAKDRLPTPQAVMVALLPFMEEGRRPRLAPLAEPATQRQGLVGAAAIPPRILIVDPDAARRAQLIRPLLANRMECRETEDAETALKLLRAEPVELVICALDLPQTSGRDLLKELRDNPPCQNLKIIMTASNAGADEMAALLNQGADDAFCLPLSNIQLLARVRAAVKHKQVQDRTDRLSGQLLELNAELERCVTGQASDFTQTRNALVLALARLVEYRSNETIAHLSRMQRYAAILAQEAAGAREEAGAITTTFLETIECCAPLHDIGNVGLPDRILLKVGKFTDEERAIMQTHTIIGAETLQEVARRFGPELGFLEMAIDIARHHHEQFDGTGYPDGLTGKHIPLAARIVAIADAYDALRSRRGQRPGLPHGATVNLLCDSSPGKYDPALLHAFRQCAAQFDRVFRDIPDSIVVD